MADLLKKIKTSTLSSAKHPYTEPDDQLTLIPRKKIKCFYIVWTWGHGCINWWK